MPAAPYPLGGRGARRRRGREAARRVRHRRASGFAEGRAAAGASGPRRSTAIEIVNLDTELAAADRAGVRRPCDAADAVARRGCSRTRSARPSPSRACCNRRAIWEQWADAGPPPTRRHDRRRGRARADRAGGRATRRDAGVAMPIPELRVSRSARCRSTSRPEHALTGNAVAMRGDRARDSRRAPVRRRWTASRRRPRSSSRRRMRPGRCTRRRRPAGGGRARDAARPQQRPGVVHDDDL